MIRDIKTSSLKRNPEKIKSLLRTTNKVTSCLERLFIYIPVRFVNIGMTVLGSNVETISVFAIVDENNNYTSVATPANIVLSPNSIGTVTVDGESYVELVFEKGNAVLPTTTIVVTTKHIQPIAEEFFQLGNIPWFLSYSNIANILRLSDKLCGNGIGKNQFIFSIFASIISRSIDDKNVFYRHTDMKKNPTYVGISDIRYSYSTTGAKLVGGYMSEGIVNAIASKETETSPVMEHLRR